MVTKHRKRKDYYRKKNNARKSSAVSPRTESTIKEKRFIVNKKYYIKNRSPLRRQIASRWHRNKGAKQNVETKQSSTTLSSISALNRTDVEVLKRSKISHAFSSVKSAASSIEESNSSLDATDNVFSKDIHIVQSVTSITDERILGDQSQDDSSVNYSLEGTAMLSKTNFSNSSSLEKVRIAKPCRIVAGSRKSPQRHVPRGNKKLPHHFPTPYEIYLKKCNPTYPSNQSINCKNDNSSNQTSLDSSFPHLLPQGEDCSPLKQNQNVRQECKNSTFRCAISKGKAAYITPKNANSKPSPQCADRAKKENLIVSKSPSSIRRRKSLGEQFQENRNVSKQLISFEDRVKRGNQQSVTRHLPNNNKTIHPLNSSLFPSERKKQLGKDWKQFREHQNSKSQHYDSGFEKINLEGKNQCFEFNTTAPVNLTAQKNQAKKSGQHIINKDSMPLQMMKNTLKATSNKPKILSSYQSAIPRWLSYLRHKRHALKHDLLKNKKLVHAKSFLTNNSNMNTKNGTGKRLSLNLSLKKKNIARTKKHPLTTLSRKNAPHKSPRVQGKGIIANPTFRQLSVYSQIQPRKRNAFKLPFSTDSVVKKLTEKCIDGKSSPLIKAKSLVKWCLFYRKRHVFGFQKAYKKLKSKCQNCVELIRTCDPQQTKENLLKEQIEIVLGQSSHSSTTESYFSETSYNFDVPLPSSLDYNKNKEIGNPSVDNVFPELRKNKKGTFFWKCSSRCNLELNTTTRYVYRIIKKLSKKSEIQTVRFLRDMNNCSSNCSKSSKRGHSYDCRINNGNGAPLVRLQNIMPHFGQVRAFVRSLLNMKQTLGMVHDIDTALHNADVAKLEILADKAKNAGEAFRLNSLSYEDEDDIMNKHAFAIKAHDKVMENLPIKYCLACERLCCSSDLQQVSRLRKVPDNETWKNILSYAQAQNITATHICQFCLRKVRAKDEVPSIAALNNLQVHPVPSEIADLNVYEIMFIQRAKVFQVVTKMGTVGNKKIPSTHLNSKVVGRTFHLPLPLEETLKKVLEPHEAVMPNQEFFIQLRGLPTKQKIIWESLIDVSKVYTALQWLKVNNPLYAEVRLPKSAADLLQCLDDDVDTQFPLPSDTTPEAQVDETEKQAMVTPCDAQDVFYEQFTICPVQESRIKKPGSELYQMRRIDASPIDTRDTNLDLMCFPDLYPKGVNGMHEKRTTPLQPAEFVKTRLMSRHPQFRRNQQHLFYLLNQANMRQLAAGIYQVLNTSRLKLTKGELFKKLEEGKLEGDLTNVFSRLRNTDAFWAKPRSEILCMIENYGSPTFFLTLSPADYDDEKLYEYFKAVNMDRNKDKSLSALIAADPVSVARYFDQKFKAMLDFLCAPDGPLGHVEHYAWRREYQGRGTQHFHLLLWVKNAPIKDVSTDAEVAEFIQKHISCSLPDKRNIPELHKKVIKYQTHRHNAYCMRKKNRKGQKSPKKICRFSFPRNVTNTMILRSVATSIAGRRNLNSNARFYDLPRKNTEKFINDYNPAILSVWTGNIDIQFVSEKSAVIAKYLTKYTTKPEKCQMKDLFKDINNTKSLQSRLWNIALRALSNRECGALEAVDTLLGIPLYGTDKNTVIRWIDVRKFRNRKMKTKKELECLASDDTDLFCASLVDTHYPNRPEELEDLSLYYFARHYDIIKTEPSREDTTYYPYPGYGFFRLRNKNPYLIRHTHFDPRKKPEDYFYSVLLLFKPWRQMSDLLDQHKTYEEAFSAEKDNLEAGMQYHEKQHAVKTAAEAMEQLIEEKAAENEIISQEQAAENENNHVETNIFSSELQAEMAMEEFRAERQDDDESLESMESKLNADQKRVYDYVRSTMTSSNENDPSMILRHFVSGVGGTGKSFLIKVIKKWIVDVLHKDVAVLGPTGIAAWNVNGLTIHRFLMLPVEHGGDMKYHKLSDAVLQVLRKNMENVALIIIDEISMVSNVMLRFIHMRLAEIFNTADEKDGWFGKIPLLVTGDLLQLPPVKANSPYMDLDAEECERYFSTTSDINIWKEKFTFDELTINMRQRDDQQFSNLLARIRLGFCSKNDLKILQSRQIEFKSTSAPERLKELSHFILNHSDEPVCLLPTRKLCKELNNSILSLLPGEKIVLKAKDSVESKPQEKTKALKKLKDQEEDCSRSGGLEKEISIKLGARVMLRRNIDVEKGYVNGATGTVLKVLTSGPNNTPKSLKLQMKNGILELDAIKCKFEILPGVYIHREQFPISLSYGITIHKSQGLSLRCCVVDIGNLIFSKGQSYVALSRVTSLQGLHIINIDPSNIQPQMSAIQEYNRLRAKFTPHLKALKADSNKQKSLPDKTWVIKDSTLFCEEPDVPQTTRLLPAFTNNDQVSCYANAVVQSLLSYQPLLSALINSNGNNPLKLLTMRSTLISTPMSTSDVRKYAGVQYEAQLQHDAPEFLNDLTNRNDVLKRFITHTQLQITRCALCKRVVKEETTLNNIVPLKISNDTETVSVMLDKLSTWSDVESIEACSVNNCSSKLYEQRMIFQNTSNLLIFQVGLFRTTVVDNVVQVQKNSKFKVKALPTTPLTINNNRYQLHATVFHHGNTPSNGHYTAIVRKKRKFILADDLLVKETRWPSNAKDAYLLFYKKV